MSETRVYWRQAICRARFIQREFEFFYGLAKAGQGSLAIGALFCDQIVNDQAMVVRIVAEGREKYFYVAPDALARRAALTMNGCKPRPQLLRHFDCGSAQKIGEFLE